MTDVLVAWLTELRLSRAVSTSSLAADFANGFLLAEVLALHNQLPSPLGPSFLDSGRMEAVRSNWASCAPALFALGVRLTAVDVSRIVAGDPKQVGALLYAVYSHLSKALRHAHDSGGPLMAARVSGLAAC